MCHFPVCLIISVYFKYTTYFNLILIVTFEDKRKENFDKGQAELERRRQMLQEQMRQQEQARMEKERQEQEKRERVRFVHMIKQ